jgi:adenine-specific DNA-methyltransferase
MQKLDASDPATRSADMIAANVEHLKSLFPDAFVEGRIDFDVLRQLLGESVEEREEKYGLNWHGKRRARQRALTPSAGTLSPTSEDSVDWDSTQNLMIEGDNLEVLKLLQKSYSGKVKLIFIDPPYNTGKDFVYPDNFQDSIRSYLEITGQIDGGAKISSNAESSGRFHTDWLNMMYPRMKLARSLLGPSGVLFATIDDSECSNLRLLLDDVFGPENFVSSIAWKKRSSPDARDTIGSVHDWLLCYVRDAALVKSAIGKMPLSESRVEAYSNPDNDPRGDWASVDMTGMTGRATKDQYFDVTLPSKRVIGPPPGRSWGLAERTFLELRADNRIWFGKGGDNVPRIKRFLSESDGQVVPSFWDMPEVGSNDEATAEVTELLGEPGVFDTPKPVRLLDRIVQISTKADTNDIVVDFFAGSGTTGHAVVARNAIDGGNRRFICVQLPEPLDPERKDQSTAAKFCLKLKRPANIAELTKERLRRAFAKIRKENPLFAGDLGFRVFKLNSSTLKTWDANREDLGQTLFENLDHIKPDRTSGDLLYESILKRGLDLCVPVELRTIAGADVYSIGGGVILACIVTSIDTKNVDALANGIVGWHRELRPAGETVCLFRDSAFADDVSKTNLAAILNQHGLTNVRSL